MNRRSAWSAVLVFSAFSGLALSPAMAQDSEVEKVELAIQALREIVELPEEGLPQWLLSKAQGMAIIPGVIKAAWGIGGQYGKGILVLRGEDGRWSSPCFIKIAGGSVGWQIGVQRADIVLVFKTRQSVENITQGKFTLGADAGVTAGPVGRKAEASTDLELQAEIYSYSKSKGLFAGVSISGASISIDNEANEDFYSRRNVSAREILLKDAVKGPDIVGTLKSLLASYAKRP